MDLLPTLIGLRRWAFLIGQKGDLLGFFCLIFSVFVQINAKEINSRTVLAKHAKTFTPSEENWEKILFIYLFLF